MRLLSLALVAVLALAACSPVAEDTPSPDPIAEFRVGHVAVVAPDPLQGPVSRTATPEEWIDALTPAIKDRLSRFEGDQFYHVGVNVTGFALAPPGIPLVASPKSLLILDVNLWEDATRTRLTPEPHQIVVGEGLSAETMISSGLTRNKARQMEILSERAAAAIEAWLRSSQAEKGWFSKTE